MVEVQEKLQNMPNHRIIGKNLIEIFFRALNANINVIEETITGEAFMGLRWEYVSKIFD